MSADNPVDEPIGVAVPPPVEEAPPQAATQPAPAPEAPSKEEPSPSFDPNKSYLPRAFGLDWEGLFIEGTIYINKTVAPHQMNADGRFATEDVPVMANEDPWTEYTSLDDLKIKTGWTEAIMQGFMNHLQAILNRP
jgi:hypothetical protein